MLVVSVYSPATPITTDLQSSTFSKQPAIMSGSYGGGGYGGRGGGGGGYSNGYDRNGGGYSNNYSSHGYDVLARTCSFSHPFSLHFKIKIKSLTSGSTVTRMDTEAAAEDMAAVVVVTEAAAAAATVVVAAVTGCLPSVPVCRSRTGT